ncbi:MAG: HEAT repeat domain-containing protein, partial [Planctomycetota bacterium]|nr:HEAT repeat domain-containing protein [Planctomycetota bacterium]
HAASYIRSDETTRRYSSDETPTLLRGGLSDERLEVQRDLLKAFPRLRFASKDILPRLVELLSAEQPEVREAAIGAIRCLGIDVASGACQKIAERLADPTPSLRVAVCRVLSWLGLDAVSSIPALVCCVAKDENPDVLRSAARALVIIDPDGEHVSLVDKPTERHALIDALRLLGETGRDFRRSLESRWASSDRESPPLHAYWMTQTEIGRQLNVSSKTVARDIAKKKLRVKGQKGKGTGRLFLVAQEELDRCKRPVTHDPGKK